jgi:hypothetical protein
MQEGSSMAKVEHFPMRQVNDAPDHLRVGKASDHVVLDATG